MSAPPSIYTGTTSADLAGALRNIPRGLGIAAGGVAALVCIPLFITLLMAGLAVTAMAMRLAAWRRRG